MRLKWPPGASPVLPSQLLMIGRRGAPPFGARMCRAHSKVRPEMTPVRYRLQRRSPCPSLGAAQSF
jgi:hypothetical protein